jgi:hypothetical protein
MARTQPAPGGSPVEKPLVWLHGEIKTPPFTEEGRWEAGMLLRQLQLGQIIGAPNAKPLPDVGKRCGELRVRDEHHSWRVVYRIDSDAVLILDVFAKKTQKLPDEVIQRCRDRMKRYDEASKKRPNK